MSTSKKAKTADKSKASARSIEDHTISYQTLPSSPNHSEKCQEVSSRILSDVLSSSKVAPDGGSSFAHFTATVTKNNDKDLPVSLVSNIPEAYEPEVSRRDFTVYRLRRQVASLRADVKNKNDKLTRCLLQLVDEVRMFKLGLQEGQWETYSEIQKRLHRLEGLIGLIQDPTAGQHTEMEELQKMLRKVEAQT